LLNNVADQEKASSLCRMLNEELWTPASQDTFSLNNSLSYLAYQNITQNSQLFWVGTKRLHSEKTSCQAVDISGNFHEMDCQSKLQTLCTQSAPVSNLTFANNSATYQITHQVGNTSLTGFRDFYTWKFLGVRYAPKPVRFEPSSIFDGNVPASAVAFSPLCPQGPHDFPGPFDEDCLFLNVWTPYIPVVSGGEQKRLKPVMVYIFGGGLYSGSSGNPHTDCTGLASRGDVVCVSINYRLGNLGFLVLNDGVHNGNYGLYDIITALKWVSKNVHAFGGDASRVTIFGESGGANAVRAMLASPMAKGLFSAAIMQSQAAGIDPDGPFSNYSSTAVSFDRFTKLVLNLTGCVNDSNELQCLRTFDAEALVTLGVIDKGTKFSNANAQ
jgi:carboxylesterase type B